MTVYSYPSPFSCVMGTASDLYLFYCAESHGVITQGTCTAVTQGMWHVSLKHRKCVSLSLVGSTSSSYFQCSGLKFCPDTSFLVTLFVAFSNLSTIGLCNSKQTTIASGNISSNLAFTNYPAHHSHITLSNYPSNHLHITPLITHKLPHISFTKYSANQIITLPVIH